MTATFPATVTLTGTIADASGLPVSGTVTAVPVALYGTQAKPVTVTDASGFLVVAPSGVRRRFDASSGGAFSMPLAATDTAGLAPSGWAYQFTLDAGIAGTAETFTALVPGSPSTLDFSALVPAVPGTALNAYVPITGGTLSGTLTLGGTPALRIPSGAAAGDYMSADGSGNASWAQKDWPDVLNVKAAPYGAAGNGTTADDTAIQSAITAAASSGGTVFLPPGNYKLVTGLTMHSSVSIRGAGALTSVLRPVSGITALTAAGSSGAQVTQTVYEDFGITGPGQGVGAAPGMSLTWCTTGTRMSRLYVQNCGGDGIIASNSYTVSMRDCFLATNGANGLNAQTNINSWAMSGNTALLNTQWGYYIMGGAAGVLHACDAESNGYGGAALLGTFSYNIEGGEYENNGSSMSGQQCGIYVGTGTGSYGAANNTQIRGNWIQGTSVADYGIVADAATRTVIEGNGFQNNLLNHIRITASASTTVLRTNNFLSTPSGGNVADASGSSVYDTSGNLTALLSGPSTAQDNGYICQNFDPMTAPVNASSGMSNYTGGQVFLSRIDLRQATVSGKKLYFYWVKPTGGSPANCYFAAFSSAGGQIGSATADLTSTSSGIQSITLPALAPQSLYGALLIGTQGSTAGGAMYSNGAAGLVSSLFPQGDGLTASSYRCAHQLTGQTAMPGSLTMGSNAASILFFWLAIGT